MTLEREGQAGAMAEEIGRGIESSKKTERGISSGIKIEIHYESVSDDGGKSDGNGKIKPKKA